MAQKSSADKRLWFFFVLAYAFSWAFWVPQALAAQGMDLPSGVSAFLNSPANPAAFGPLVAAVALTWIEKGWRGVLDLLKRGLNLRFPKVWLLAILLLPVVIYAGGILLATAMGAVALDLSVLANPVVALIAPIVILFTAGPLQEEFGWRGYALPRLQMRWSALVSSLILGGLWWLWHLPLVFIPGKFMVGGLPLFLLLAVEIVLTTILMTWIYNHTGGSVLAALLFHTAMNWSIWIVLPGMQANLATLGCTIFLLAVVVAVVLWRWGTEMLPRGRLKSRS